MDVVDEMAGSCVLMRTRLIARVVTGIFDDALRTVGINAAQLALLVTIARMGPSRRADIGRVSHQDRSTLTRNLKLMLDQGWIEEVQTGPGRGRRITPTASGSSLLSEAAPSWRRAQVEAAALLGTDGVAVVTDLGDALMGFRASR